MMTRGDVVLHFTQSLSIKNSIFVLLLTFGAVSLHAQIFENDIEVNLTSFKLECEEDLKRGDKQKALEKLVLIVKEYKELNLWDSVYLFNQKTSDLALELGEKQIHIEAFLGNVSIDDLFGKNFPPGWEERMSYLFEIKEDEELKAEWRTLIFIKLAWFYQRTERRDSAIILINRGIQISQKYSDKERELTIRREAATILVANGKFDEAIDHLLFVESSELFNSSPELVKCRVYLTMGNAFLDIGDFTKCKLYFEKLIGKAAAQGYNLMLARGNNRFARLYVSKNKPDEAIRHVMKAIPVFEEKELHKQHTDALITAAAAYNLKKEYKTANEYLDSAFLLLPLDERESNYFGYYRIKIKNELGLNNASEAAKSFSKMQEFTGLKNSTSIINKLGYRVAKAQNRPKVALRYLEKYKLIEDSLRNSFNQSRTNRLEAEFNRNAQNEKIAQLDSEKAEHEKVLARRNKTLMGGFLFLSIVTGLLFFLFRLYRRNKRSNHLLKTQNKVINDALGENKLLLKEIHHRVKNNLQVISSLLSLQERKVGDEQTKEALKSSKTRVETMSILHQSLYQNDEYKMISAPEYFDKLMNNLISSYALRDDLETTVEIEDFKFDVETLIPIGLIANELICNSLKHGIGERENGKLEVKLYEKDAKVILSVKDDGGKIVTDFLKVNRGSLGVKLIKAFSNRLDAEIEIENGHQSVVRVVMDKSVLEFKGAA